MMSALLQRLIRRHNNRFLSTAPSFSAVYDVIVVGGGHAGCESAAASARTGASTLLVTNSKDKIGEMSCNPSFGGIGKGHLLREIDALDGVSPRICDKSAITYQALNRGQGPAVLGLRAQIDREQFKRHMQQEILHKTPNLSVIEGSVEDLHIQPSSDGTRQSVSGVCLEDGTIIGAQAVVITTGTFLNGTIFQGDKRWSAGRMGERASIGLSKTLADLGFTLGRLRTGTPARLLKKTIDFSKFQVMPPDSKPIPFSFMTDSFWLPPEKQLPTYIGYTTEEVARIVRDNLHQNEHIRSDTLGPRYCPSLESKILKFSNTIHKTFLEHEGYDSDLIYPQGMSMTFTPEVQLKVMRCIKGLENVEIAQYGYGVQYDFVNPQELYPSLETRKLPGLFLAGQINGTTGYEEAAAQGVLAGINAGALVRKVAPLIVDRSEGYLGVLVDDLTSLGTNEPYRMFTSRAEFRLHLRPDNADLRLTQRGRDAHAVLDKRYDRFLYTKNRLNSAIEALKGIEMSVAKWQRCLPSFTRKDSGKVFTAFDLLYRHNIKLSTIADVFPDLKQYADDASLEERLRVEGTYAKQHSRLLSKMEEIKRESTTVIPPEMDYSQMIGLSFECREKFEIWRPQNLAAASRIPGVTPDGLATLLRYIQKGEISTHPSVASVTVE